MKFKISQYYLFILALLTIHVAWLDIGIGMRYISFFVLNVVMLHFTRKNHRVTLLVFLGTIFLSYFLRGYIVSFDYSRFTYIDLYEVNRNKILWAYDTTLIASFFFSVGFLLFSFRFSKKKRIANNLFYSDFFMSSFWAMMSVLVGLVALKLFLVTAGGVGRRGVENETQLAFLMRLIPLDLPFVIISIYLFKYGKVLKRNQRIVILLLLSLFSFAVLLQGSKTFVMIFGMCYALHLVYSHTKVRIATFSILLLIGTAITAFSFAMAHAVKISYFTTGMSSNDIFLFGLQMMSEQDLGIVLNDITARFNGFDGQLKYLGMLEPKEYDNLIELKKPYQFSQIGLHVLEGMLPKVEFTEVSSCGKSVGVYVEKMPPTKVHAGALGFTASFILLAGRSYWLLALVIGMIFALIVKLLNFIRDADVKYLFFFFYIYMVMILAMACNFDAFLEHFIVKSCIGAIVVLIVKTIVQIRKSKSRGIDYEMLPNSC